MQTNNIQSASRVSSALNMLHIKKKYIYIYIYNAKWILVLS